MKRLKEIPRSGDLISSLLKVDLSECIEVDTIYEIINPELKAVIQNLVKSKAKRILLDTRIVIAASNKLSRIIESFIPGLVSYGTLSIPLVGVLAPLKSVILSFAAYGASVAGLAYSVMHYFPIFITNTVPGAGAIIATGIIAWATVTTPQVQRTLIPLTGTCSQFIRPVARVEVIDNSGNSHIIQSINEAFENSSENVYFYDFEQNKYYINSDLVQIVQVEMKLHVKTETPNSGVCEYKKIESLGIQNEISVKETCTPRKYKYIPLSERTMTIADLNRRNKNVKEITKNTQGAIEAYESASSKYAAKRIREHPREQAEYLQNPKEISKKTENLSSSS